VWPSLIFDSLDHHLLFYRLSGLGVGGVELQWFVDYLTNHKQHVGKGNHYSDWAAVLGGIPQGSVLLGHYMLFLVYVNDIPSQVLHGLFLHR